MRNGPIYVMLAVLGGCAGTMQPEPVGTAVQLTAELRDAAGVPHGMATFTDGRLTINAVGFAPGAHGLHIHTIGRCDAPEFKTAGDHWNPTMKQHGRDNPMGMHGGDLPNLLIGTDGRGTVSVDIAENAMTLTDSDGSAIIVHAAADDLKTDPSGNSGGRISCGVFGPS